MEKVRSLKVSVFLGVLALLSGGLVYGQVKPFGRPFPLPQTGIWQIVRFWTEPACYTKLPDRDNTIAVKAIFECRGPKRSTCKDLIVRGRWHSSIEDVTREINLTRAVIDTCGPRATACTVIWDGEKMDVRLVPKLKRIEITKIGYISPRLTGNITLTLEAFTGGKLTSQRKLVVRPCPGGEREPQGRADLMWDGCAVPEVFRAGPDEVADVKLSCTIKNAGSAPAVASYAEVLFKAYPGGDLLDRSQVHVPALAPGEMYSVNAFSRLPKGNYQVCATADSTKVIPESNEGNNRICRPFSVRR